MTSRVLSAVFSSLIICPANASPLVLVLSVPSILTLCMHEASVRFLFPVPCMFPGNSRQCTLVCFKDHCSLLLGVLLWRFLFLAVSVFGLFEVKG